MPWDPLSLGECFRRASLSVAQRRVSVRPRFSGFNVSLGRFSVYGRSYLVILSGDGGAFLKVEMPVRRSLKLDGLLKANSFDSPKITRKKSAAAAYSPTTGTCQMSPIASPTSSKEQENRNGPSNGKRENLNHLSINKRKESTMQDNEFMVLLTKVEKSSEEFMEIMQSLSSIQALKGSKELENLIGIPHASCVFKREMQKTKELMTNVIKQKLFKKNNSGLPNKELDLAN